VPTQFPEWPCTFCLTWQLTQWGGGNVWVVIPPYPMLQEQDVACETGQMHDVDNTTPPLVPGTFRMTTTLAAGPCIGGPADVPVRGNVNDFVLGPAS
jgi:hypothetical protein